MIILIQNQKSIEPNGTNSETQEMETYLEQDFIEKWGGILILLQPKA